MKDFYTSKAKLNELKKKKDLFEREQTELSNRLKLMTSEEEKAKRQIKETEKRAKSIEEYRRSKEEFLKRKEEKKYSELQEVFKRRVQMIRDKNLRKLNIDLNKSFVSLKNKEDASEIKEYHKHNETKISNYQSEVLFSNILKARNIKEQKKIIGTKRKLIWDDMRMKAKIEYENKITEHELMLKKKEAEVLDLQMRKEEHRRVLEEMSYKKKRALSMYERIYKNYNRPFSERSSDNKNAGDTTDPNLMNITPVRSIKSDLMDLYE